MGKIVFLGSKYIHPIKYLIASSDQIHRKLFELSLYIFSIPQRERGMNGSVQKILIEFNPYSELGEQYFLIYGK